MQRSDEQNMQVIILQHPYKYLSFFNIPIHHLELKWY